MGQYDSQIALAKKLIAKYGQKVTLKIFTTTIPDPNSPWKPGAPGEALQEADGVFLRYEQSNIDGELIQSGDQKVLIPSEGLVIDPDVQGQVIRGSETWKIVKVSALNPNGQTILYTVQVRR
jgi:hypothetical protein